MEKKNEIFEEINIDDIQIKNTDLDKNYREIKKKADKMSKGIFNDNFEVVEFSKEEKKSLEKNYKKHVIDNPYDSITVTQYKAIVLYLKGETKKSIASSIGVSVPTLNSWFTNDNFNEVLDKSRNELMEVNKNKLSHLMEPAMMELANILSNAERDSDKLSAIKLIFDANGITNKAKVTNNINSTGKTVIAIHNENNKNDDVRIISPFEDVIDV